MARISIHAINLDEDTERMDRVTAQLQEQGLSYTRFSAFRGWEIPNVWKE